MSYQNFARVVFPITVIWVLYLALTPGSVSEIVKSDAERHWLAFLILPALCFVGWPKLGIIRLWLTFAGLGAAIEIAQWAMNVGRQAQWSDWIHDLMATSISLFSCWIVARLSHREAQS